MKASRYGPLGGNPRPGRVPGPWAPRRGLGSPGAAALVIRRGVTHAGLGRPGEERAGLPPRAPANRCRAPQALPSCRFGAFIRRGEGFGAAAPPAADGSTLGAQVLDIWAAPGSP